MQTEETQVLSNPKISIVTVVYNAEKELEKTIESVKRQRYSNIEYIIVDGASKDNTLQLITRNADVISSWISEKDHGIYDAMNKGLAMATGDFVWFLNAGDCIDDDNFLEEVFGNGQPVDGDIYYGETRLVDSQWRDAGIRRLRAPEVLTRNSFKWGMLVCHQSILVRKNITRPYNCKYHCSADFDWVLYAMFRSRKNVNTHRIVSRYLKGGKSRKMMVRSWFERFEIMKNYYGWISTLACHVVIFFRLFYHFFRDFKWKKAR